METTYEIYRDGFRLDFDCYTLEDAKATVQRIDEFSFFEHYYDIYEVTKTEKLVWRSNE